MLTHGIDVSSNNRTMPPATSYAFALVKCTEGHTYVSPTYARQVSTIRAAGKVLGHYLFLWPGDVPAQVAYFREHATVRAGDIVAVDWETTTAGTHASSAEKDQALKLLRAVYPHSRVLLYCNRDFWLNVDTSSGCGDGLWIADPDRPAGQPAVTHSWLLHQFSSLAGIDRDVYGGTEQALRAWAGALAPRPAPPHAYTVRPGDTLSGIAAAHHIRLADLEHANPQIKNPNVIVPGETIHLP